MKVTCSICGKRREMASELSFDGTYWYAFCRECAPATVLEAIKAVASRQQRNDAVGRRLPFISRQGMAGSMAGVASRRAVRAEHQGSHPQR